MGRWEPDLHAAVAASLALIRDRVGRTVTTSDWNGLAAETRIAPAFESLREPAMILEIFTDYI